MFTTFLRLGLLAPVLLLSGCAGAPPADYAARYETALERYPGTAPAPPASVAAFIRFFEDLQAADWRTQLASLYADQLHFSDTLAFATTRAGVERHFAGLQSQAPPEVQILNQVTDGADAYLIWTLTFQFRPVARTVTSHTIGMTHLRFDAAGRIVLHQDFWDSTAGFYGHLPVLGTAVRAIGNRFQVEDNP